MSLYHPIGTIVKLTIDEDMLFVISGYLTRQDTGYPHDYFAVPFPLGLIEEHQYISFNRECITEVVHEGYCDDECESVLSGFDCIVENLKHSWKPTIDKAGDNNV